MTLSRIIPLVFLIMAGLPAPAPAIVNGSLTTQWPGVGFVIIDNAALCTGVAVAPRWVVTAAHCLSGAQSIVFGVGPDPGLPDVQLHAAAQLLIDPNYNSNTLDHDVGLIQLADTLAVTPFVVNDQAAPSVGSLVAIMGYGVSSSGGSDDKKRIGTSSVNSLTSLQIFLDPVNGVIQCVGDGGGPVFVSGSNGFPVLLATNSYGDANCTQFSVNDRADSELNFMQAAIGNLCLRSAPSGPNCDGVFRNGYDPG